MCKRWALEALQVQDACNLSGVVHAYSQAMSDMNRVAFAIGKGTEWKNQCCVAVLFAFKCMSLAGITYGWSSQDLYEIAERTAKQWAAGNVSEVNDG